MGSVSRRGGQHQVQAVDMSWSRHKHGRGKRKKEIRPDAHGRGVGVVG